MNNNKNENKLAKRDSALDITRIVAMFTVISVHFFLNNGFYGAPMIGKKMWLMTTVRTGFMICVPLFIMLTGYLMKGKELSKSYYKGIVKTLGIYVLASLTHVVYKVIVFKYKLSSDLTFWGILNYSTANYSWYIEMYIGLFLLIPFLNAMWKGLETKGKKLALVLTLIAVTSLPSIVNVYNFSVENWWKTPYLSTEYRYILPDWWTRIYPFTYYFLGAYLREFPIKLRQWQKLGLFALSVLVFGSYNFWRSQFGFFAWGVYCDWYGFPTLVMTVLSFSFLSSINTAGYPIWLKRVLKTLSDLSLGAYLLSYIFDNLMYAELNRAIPEVVDRMPWYFVIVPAVFICSLALSGVINLIYAGLANICSTVWEKFKPAPLPVYETERLILRGFKDSDAEDWFEFARDPNVGPNAGWKPHETLADSRRLIKFYRKVGEYAIVERASGKVIGSLGLRPRFREGLDFDLELGYSLSREYWGRGIMPEACRCLMSAAFDNGARTVAAAHFPDNDRSRRVIEKLGFEFVKCCERSYSRYDGAVLDELVYAVSAERFSNVESDASASEILTR